MVLIDRLVVGSSEGPIAQGLTLVDSKQWEAITMEGEPPPEYVCPYCGAVFATQEALLAHIESEHPSEEPPPNGEAPEWEKYLKWGLIGGGILVFAVAVRSGLKRGGK